ncbi:MAG: acyl-CoA desaturase [Bacteroidetes bacterium]|nr:acyl-CoA desaturase [Bacteroidota bacterium]
MKTIRFIDNDKLQFATAVRKNVNAYFKEKKISMKGGGRMLFKSAAMLSLYLAPFVLILFLPMSVWMLLLLAVVMGVGMAGTGMGVMHDAMHGSFSKMNWMNNLFGSTMYMIGGNVFNWKMQHNILHHTFTNINGFDEDIRSRVVIRMSHEEPLKKIHRFQHIYAFFFYCLMTLTKFSGDFFQLREYNKKGILKDQKKKPAREFFILILSKAIYLFVVIGLPMLIAPFAWWQLLLVFVIVHLTAGIIMSIIFQMAHVVEGAEQPTLNTEGNIENEWAVHEMHTTANFARKSRLMSWFIGGLNFQIEHHLFPNISHVHYKKISPIVERTAKEFGLPYNQKRTFFTALASHVRTLKVLGREKAILDC